MLTVFSVTVRLLSNFRVEIYRKTFQLLTDSARELCLLHPMAFPPLLTNFPILAGEMSQIEPCLCAVLLLIVPNDAIATKDTPLC